MLLTAFLLFSFVAGKAQVRAKSLPATDSSGAIAARPIPIVSARALLSLPAYHLMRGNATFGAIDRNAAARHLPFFCEGERIMDKKLPVPLRLRLGSIQQTDWLEGKPAASHP